MACDSERAMVLGCWPRFQDSKLHKPLCGSDECVCTHDVGDSCVPINKQLLHPLYGADAQHIDRVAVHMPWMRLTFVVDKHEIIRLVVDQIEKKSRKQRRHICCTLCARFNQRTCVCKHQRRVLIELPPLQSFPTCVRFIVPPMSFALRPYQKLFLSRSRFILGRIEKNRIQKWLGPFCWVTKCFIW